MKLQPMKYDFSSATLVFAALSFALALHVSGVIDGKITVFVFFVASFFILYSLSYIGLYDFLQGWSNYQFETKNKGFKSRKNGHMLRYHNKEIEMNTKKPIGRPRKAEVKAKSSISLVPKKRGRPKAKTTTYKASDEKRANPKAATYKALDITSKDKTATYKTDVKVPKRKIGRPSKSSRTTPKLALRSNDK